MIDIESIKSGIEPYFHRYIDKVPEGDILEILDEQLAEIEQFFRQIPAEKVGYRYAEGKWAPREILGHLIDTERVFQYRALRFARRDGSELPGFDENDYVDNANFDGQSLEELLDEFKAVRTSGLYLFRSFKEEDWEQGGIASGNKASVAAMVYVLAGHPLHHLDVIRERYL